MVNSKSVFIVLILTIIFYSYTSAQKIVNIRDFGATGKGLEDETQYLQKAIDEAAKFPGSIVFLPKGIYLLKSFTITNNYLENYILRLADNITIKGEGQNSVIKLANHLFDKRDINANAHVFYGLNLKNVRLDNFLIDMNGRNNLVPKGTLKNYSSIFSKRGNNLIIENIVIKNSAGRTMINIMGAGKNLHINNNNFINGGPYVGNQTLNPNQNDFSFLYSEWDSTTISNNIICQDNVKAALTNYNGGIEIHGSNSLVNNNHITGCWPGLYITSSMSNTLENVAVVNNVFNDCAVGISFWIIQPMENIRIQYNKIGLRNPTQNDHQLVTGILIPNGNSTEYSISFANASFNSHLFIDSNYIFAKEMKNPSQGISVHSVHNSVISNNLISGMNYAGISIAGSIWGIDSLKIKKNTFSGFLPNNHKSLVGGFFVITDTYSKTQKKAKGFKNIEISDNRAINNLNFLNSKTNVYNGFIALPQKLMNQVIRKNNDFGNTKDFHTVITD